MSSVEVLASAILCNIFSYLEFFDLQRTVVIVCKRWTRDYQTKMCLNHNVLIDIGNFSPKVLMPHVLPLPTRLRIRTEKSNYYEPIVYLNQFLPNIHTLYWNVNSLSHLFHSYRVNNRLTNVYILSEQPTVRPFLHWLPQILMHLNSKTFEIDTTYSINQYDLEPLIKSLYKYTPSLENLTIQTHASLSDALINEIRNRLKSLRHFVVNKCAHNLCNECQLTVI